MKPHYTVPLALLMMVNAQFAGAQDSNSRTGSGTKPNNVEKRIKTLETFVSEFRTESDNYKSALYDAGRLRQSALETKLELQASRLRQKALAIHKLSRQLHSSKLSLSQSEVERVSSSMMSLDGTPGFLYLLYTQDVMNGPRSLRTDRQDIGAR